jgi:PPK2 family polyphosphate:nucleotide phosphotransferase
MSYAHRIDGGHEVRLSQYDPGDTHGLTKAEALTKTEKLGARLSELEDLLAYAGQHSLLIVLQGRDTSGKDGMIRKILDFSNAQTCRIESFKVPTDEELAHDFLWRIHRRAPGRGCITIFNRSHYEDVLVVRVHNLVPEGVWRKRYEHIRRFEELLLDNDTILLKFYLHISKDEQQQRLLEREQETEKAWKLSVGDWKERELWDDYTAAYVDALSEGGREKAPWFIVPADHKWFRNLAVIEQIVEALEPHHDGWLRHLQQIGKKARTELEAYRAEHGEPAAKK